MTESWRRTRFAVVSLAAVLAVLLVGGQSSALAMPFPGHPQFVDPSTGRPSNSIISMVRDNAGLHVTYLSGARFLNGTGAEVLPKPSDGKEGTQSDDYQAFVRNGYHPVVVPLSQMVASSSGIETEVGPWVTEPGCIQAPTGFDIRTATSQQLALYGFPAIGTMPRGIYNQKFSWMKQRDCESRATNGPIHTTLSNYSAQRMQTGYNRLSPQHVLVSRITSSIWEGNVADQYPCGGNVGFACPPGNPATYTEADTDFFVPNTTNPGNCFPQCNASYWAGLGGGAGTAQYELIQAGVETDYSFNIDNVYPWIEWVPGITQKEVNVPGIHNGTHVYVRVTYPNTVEVGNIDTQQFYTWTTGVNGSESTAEFITEDTGQQGLNDFGTVTFKGMGITESDGSYYPMNKLQHDYTVTLWQGSGPQLDNIGSITYDGSDYPYDDNSMTWIESCPGTCS